MLPGLCVSCCSLVIVPFVAIVVLTMTLFQVLAMPVLEKYHIDHMDRNIYICVGEIGFTMYAFPLYGGMVASTAYDVYKNQITDEDRMLLGFLPVRNKMKDMGSQVVDFLGDVGLFLAKLAVFPVWWLILWACTVVLSFLQVCLWIRGGALREETFSKTTLRQLSKYALGEHSVQVLLSIYGFTLMPPDSEYQIYSMINALLGLVRLAQRACTAASALSRPSSSGNEPGAGNDKPLLSALQPEAIGTDKPLLSAPQPETMAEGGRQILAAPMSPQLRDA